MIKNKREEIQQDINVTLPILIMKMYFDAVIELGKDLNYKDFKQTINEQVEKTLNALKNFKE